MLFLLFNIETERYAIPAAKVIEVVDLVNFTKIPQAPEYVSGLMNFRGQIFPVVDLPNLFLSRPYRRMLSTRIILTDVRVKKKKYTIGLIAENLTETDSFSKKQIKKAGIQLEKTPYLGKVISVDSQIIHILEVEKILPEPVLKGLVKRN